ncbi:MAG: zinc metallopeptidase [Actinobacteria bacterium]|nr:zinc metallopeptidase [Actinomycetota bacterium]
MFPFFDPLYLLLIAPAFVLAVWAQTRVRGTYQKYAQVMSSSGVPAYLAARKLLDAVGLFDVDVKRVPGELTDHYDPRHRVLRLSDGVYGSSSLAAVAIAAHEAGHAMQDKVRYPYLVLRSAMVPITTFGSQLGYFLLIIGFILAAATGAGSIGIPIAWLGLILFSTAFVFAVVTLPVEFNASTRALGMMETVGVVRGAERAHAKRVLDAAALTYVAAMFVALMQVVYFALRLLAITGARRDD